jgi:hypothetical protein
MCDRIPQTSRGRACPFSRGASAPHRSGRRQDVNRLQPQRGFSLQADDVAIPDGNGSLEPGGLYLERMWLRFHGDLCPGCKIQGLTPPIRDGVFVNAGLGVNGGNKVCVPRIDFPV